MVPEIYLALNFDECAWPGWKAQHKVVDMATEMDILVLRT